MIMPINLSGVLVLATFYMLGAFFGLVMVITGLLAVSDVVRAKGRPRKRAWELHSYASLFVGGGCFLAPHVLELPVGVVEWLENGRTWLLVPGPLLVWWILGRVLQRAYARRMAEEERERARSASRS